MCYSPWGFKESDMTEQLNWITSYYRTYRLVENVDINQIFTEIKILCDITHIETKKCSIKYNKKEADSQI